MFNGYNPQSSLDRINSHIAELERMKAQLTQQQQQMPNLTQNFQISPNQGGMKYAENLEQVEKELVLLDTPYFSRDMSVLWVKKASGDTKTYELSEIVKKDEKDLKIEFLVAKIEELEKEANYEPNDAIIDEPVESKKSTITSKGRATKSKSK
jgi:TolA-binding protein